MDLTLTIDMTQFPLVLGWVPGVAEWIIIGGFGLILFGKRLPEVGRSLGKGIVEFKKGLKGVEDDIEDASSPPPKKSLPVTHKFDPETGKPLQRADQSEQAD